MVKLKVDCPSCGASVESPATAVTADGEPTRTLDVVCGGVLVATLDPETGALRVASEDPVALKVAVTVLSTAARHAENECLMMHLMLGAVHAAAQAAQRAGRPQVVAPPASGGMRN